MLLLGTPDQALLALALGTGLDRLVGEPAKWHPLVGFGRLAGALEARMNPDAAGLPRQPRHLGSRMPGLTAWLLAVLPAVGAWWVLAVWLGPLRWLADGLALWFALGARSLGDHLEAVAAPLEQGDLPAARAAVARVVSRDCTRLDAAGVARAGVETTLENGADAVFASLFWFAVAGGAGALLHRLANTLDAMWGYRTPQLRNFGWAAARADDALNWLPARLVAGTYTALGASSAAWQCWRTQAPAWSSPNAGPVMAAGAGALGVSLGGPAFYHGALEQRPPLGCGQEPTAADLRRALALVRHGYLGWIAFLGMASGGAWILT